MIKSLEVEVGLLKGCLEMVDEVKGNLKKSRLVQTNYWKKLKLYVRTRHSWK